MTDELTRPLGLETGATRKRSRPALLIGLTAAFFVAVTGGWYVWQRLAATPEEPKPPVTAEQTAPEAKPAEQPEKTTTERTATEQKPEQAEQPGQLVAVKPDGSIEPKVPAPEIKRQELGLAHLPDPQLIEKGASGVIPKRGPDGRRPMDVYSRQPETEGNFGVARVVLIVGGLGISQTSSQDAIRRLPGAVTLAFAPSGNSLGRWMQAARKAGHELLLQLPMEPFDYPGNDPGPHTLLSDVTPAENMANMHWAMSRITNYVGVMNFLGGKLVTTPAALKPLFDDIAQRGLLFVDDGSVKNSMTEQTAKASVLPYTRAQIQIDAIRTRRDIAARLDELVKEARRTGVAIGVANAFPDSIDMIAKFAANANKLGIEITPVSAIVSDPERKGG